MSRATNIILAMVALIALSPLFLMIALLMLLVSGRPILFRHLRVGLDGSTFELLKFRSMVVNQDNFSAWSTSRDDPRITSVGKFIRGTSLDELPQLWNVLRGDMNLVGPRPDVPQQKAIYSQEEWDLRTSVRPGITGLAQATRRSEATIEERKKLDLDYVRNRSLSLDLWILWKTAVQVVGKGSY